MSANFLNTPILGKSAYPIIRGGKQELFDIRNIQEMAAFNEQLTNISSISNNPHINSLFISSLLWKISRLYSNKAERTKFALSVAEYLDKNYKYNHLRNKEKQTIQEIRFAIFAIKEVSKDLPQAEKLIDNFVDQIFN